TDTVLFVPPKYYEFNPPKLKAEIEEAQDKFLISVTSKSFAKNIELDFKSLDGVFSDNYFDLTPGQRKKVEIRKKDLSRPASLEDIKKN
ncbi:MAG: glycoside hydrolase family 2 protein, partial [Clostridiaceae bacterium]|nr:glycoside hydrolase family 2 protein [Clostridiaceae bacterium]